MKIRKIINEALPSEDMNSMFDEIMAGENPPATINTFKCSLVINQIAQDGVKELTNEEKEYPESEYQKVTEAGFKIVAHYKEAEVEMPKEPTAEEMQPFENEDIKEGALFHSVTYNADEQTNLPTIDYQNGEIKQVNNPNTLTISATGNVENFNGSIRVDEFKEKYYKDEYKVENDGKNCSYIEIKFNITDGPNKGKEIVNEKIYVSNEKLGALKSESSTMGEDFNYTCGNISINAYDNGKKLLFSTLSTPSNIPEMRKIILKHLCNPEIWYVEIYDGRGVCHYQAARISDGEYEHIPGENWNVMEDDFFITEKDDKYDLEDIKNGKWKVVFHLPYFDINDADNIESDSEKRAIVSAVSEEDAIQKGNSIILESGKNDIIWENAFVEYVENI